MIETIILCSILAVIVFGIQFVLCNKANNKSVKRIPMYIILALYAIALILCLVDWLDGSGGVAIWVIFAFVLIDLTQQATISCNRPKYWTALMR